MTPLIDELRRAEVQLQSAGESARAARFKELRSRLDLPELHVVIFGEFNRGKSTLINALLGRIVLPARLIPTTGHVTHLTHDASEIVVVRFTDGRSEWYGLSEIGKFAILDGDGIARADVESVQVGVSSPLLRRGVVLIDTPGVNDRAAQTRRARDALGLADLVLFVLDARQLLGGAERDLAVEWLSQDLGKPVVPVVNFCNFLEDRDHTELRQRLDRWCRQQIRPVFGRPWFAVNALGALKHALGNGPPPEDDFAALREALANCLGQVRATLQRRGRLGQLRDEVRRARQENAQQLAGLRADAARVERKRAELRQKLTAFARSLDALAPLLVERLTSFAQKTLDDALDSLVTIWFANESKQRLEENALRWYRDKLNGAVRDVEKTGHQELLTLAGDHLSRPEPLTLGEQMILDARLAVGDLAILNAPVAIGGGAALGAVWGTMLIPVPVVGTMIGAVVGGWLGHRFGSSTPDYPAAYTAKARECWALDAATVQRLLQSELAARLTEMKRQVERRLTEAASPPPPAEAARRESLDKVLGRCEDQLRST